MVAAPTLSRRGRAATRWSRLADRLLAAAAGVRLSEGRSLLILLASLAFLPFADAAQTQETQTEISYLLTYIGSSRCEFFRNGSWYDAKQAEDHLRSKYAALSAGGGEHTAEEFIEKTATKSSFSGRAYEVRCGGGDIVSTHDWLMDALTRFRALEAKAQKEEPSDSPAHL